MEYVEGTPLAPIESPRKLLDLAAQIADGMAAAHEAGLVHRDLKPANVLLQRCHSGMASRVPERGQPAPDVRIAGLEFTVNGVTEHHAQMPGMLSRELFEYRQRTGSDGGRDFLTVGGMGHASSIALGVALTERQREVWCLDGDGAVLMHLGSLAVIADHAPASFFHVVFNNGVHDSVGGQPTSIAVVDGPAMAAALGYRFAASEADVSSLPAVVATMRDHGGPALGAKALAK